MKNNGKPDPNSPFAHVAIGTVVTTYGERALVVHHARFYEPPPAWFTPDKNKSHGAAHLDGYSVYWQCEYNEEAREAAHPFETDVIANSVQQLTLL